MNIFIYSIQFVVLFFMVSLNAHAYLDPGSGSMLLYALIGILSTLLYSFKNVYYRIVQFFSGKKIKIDADIQNVSIIFHSEGGKYWQIFESIIKELDKQNIKMAYISPDTNDPALSYVSKSKNLIVKIVPSIMQTYMYMKQVKVPVVVSTTPQLDVYMFTRSKHVSHYAHIIHAPTDVYLYKKFAFDFYDSVFCSGPHQIQHIRMIEEKRHTSKKKLFETGCTYYDRFFPITQKEKKVICADKTTVLFAPTWGEASILTKYKLTLFEILLAENDFFVIFRPHPQMKISQAQLYTSIISTFSQHAHLKIDEERENKQSIQQADILLSDISGIIFDFAFLQQKPVVTIKREEDDGEKGYDGEQIIPFQEIWEYQQRKVLGPTVSEHDIHSLPHVIKETIAKSSLYTENINALKETSVYNFGTAGKTAAQQLQTLLTEVI